MMNVPDTSAAEKAGGSMLLVYDENRFKAKGSCHNNNNNTV